MQDPDGARDLAAQVTGIPAARVSVRMARSGGGFGRRLMSDYAAEAALLSRESGTPVQLVRSREDDLSHDYYRPAGIHHFRAALGADGRVSAWSHHLANTSRYAYALRENPAQSELYRDDIPAACVPNFRLAHTNIASAIPTGAWRATLHSSNAFAVQGFMDELAHLAGRDPLEFRLELLGDDRDLTYRDHGGPVLSTARLKGVLRLAAERAGWGVTASGGRRARHRGALHLQRIRRSRGGGRGGAGRNRGAAAGGGGGHGTHREPERGGAAGGGRIARRHAGRAPRRDQRGERPHPGKELRRLPAAPDQRGAGDRSALRARVRIRPPDSASPACRRSHRRSRTRSSRRPGGGSGGCRSGSPRGHSGRKA